MAEVAAHLLRDCSPHPGLAITTSARHRTHPVGLHRLPFHAPAARPEGLAERKAEPETVDGQDCSTFEIEAAAPPRIRLRGRACRCPAPSIDHRTFTAEGATDANRTMTQTWPDRTRECVVRMDGTGAQPGLTARPRTGPDEGENWAINALRTREPEAIRSIHTGVGYD